jgi:hypothetical protein
MSTGAPISGELPSRSQFKDALHSEFRVAVDDGQSIDLTLTGVLDRGGRPGWEQFSLLFSGPAAPAYWQGTCTVEHAVIGAFDLFLVAIVTDGDDQNYEATFNRRTA